ncbi:hypothetical protein [Scytonema hofmannii]|uniref:hypothetical protein n=1 Tax=Scytonema hofmannii TaxID=34078 RepID=UPI00034B10D8|nr:hypothetical protein [Scytonema hofmannii]
MDSTCGSDAQSEPLTPSSEPMKQLAYFLTPIRVKPPSKWISQYQETPELLDVRD